MASQQPLPACPPGGRSTPPRRTSSPVRARRSPPPDRRTEGSRTPPRSEGGDLPSLTPPGSRPSSGGSRRSSGPGGAAAAFEPAAPGPLPAEWRAQFCERVTAVPFLDHGHPLHMHGRGYKGPPQVPKMTWKSDKKPRDDHDAPKWLTASEFSDEPEVMQAKAKQLAILMRVSQKTVVYTGAGISASVIGQAARSGENKQGWKGNTREARPTFTHHALGFLGQQRLINSWIQQNHDGLPQKAGFPQENINEIHGSWYDPSNPVVKYSGSLHDRAYPWMVDDAKTADLVIVLGTSLGGLNADQVATRTAERSLRGEDYGRGGALGSVIINLQQTEQDGKMALRMFGRSDDILKLLLMELGFGRMKFAPPKFPPVDRALVPYDKNGMPVPEGGRKMVLDLSERAKVRITPGHNIQGAKQPQYMHIGADKPHTFKGDKREPAEGFGTVIKRSEDSCSYVLHIEGQTMRLGLWWMESAIRGTAAQLPIVNADPKYE